MKHYISTIVFVSTTSSALATRCDLPPSTSANGQDYIFEREYLPGGPQGTSCNDGNYESIKNVKSADECGVKCVYKGNLSSSLLLYGYDYNCDTKECDCLYGTQWEDIDTKVQPTNENMACYGLETNQMPTPGPSPDQCHLPSKTTANGNDYVFDREYIDGSSSQGTTCNDGNYESIDNVSSADECGVKCVYKGDLSSSLLLYGYDYNCDTKECDCLYGTQWEEIETKVQPTNENMACYGLEEDDEADVSIVLVSKNNQMRCQLPSSTSVNGQDYVFDREYIDGSSSSGTKCNDGNYESIKNVNSADECGAKCVYKGNLSSSLFLYGYDYSCDTRECDCLYGTQWEDIDTKVQPTNENMACYGLEQDEYESLTTVLTTEKKYLRAN